WQYVQVPYGYRPMGSGGLASPPAPPRSASAERPPSAGADGDIRPDALERTAYISMSSTTSTESPPPSTVKRLMPRRKCSDNALRSTLPVPAVSYDGNLRTDILCFEFLSVPSTSAPISLTGAREVCRPAAEVIMMRPLLAQGVGDEISTCGYRCPRSGPALLHACVRSPQPGHVRPIARNTDRRDCRSLRLEEPAHVSDRRDHRAGRQAGADRGRRSRDHPGARRRPSPR